MFSGVDRYLGHYANFVRVRSKKSGVRSKNPASRLIGFCCLGEFSLAFSQEQVRFLAIFGSLVLSKTEWVASSVTRCRIRGGAAADSSGLYSDSLEEIVQGSCDGRIEFIQVADSVDWKRRVSGKRLQDSGGQGSIDLFE